MDAGKVSRRSVLAAGALAVAPLLAACSAAPRMAAPSPPAPAVSASSIPVPTAAAASATGAAPARSGTLKLLWWQAPTILNSHLAQGSKDYDAARVVLDPLAAMGPDGVPVPRLAASIPTVSNGGVSPDLQTVTWKLRPGVKWSDGTDFTADDVLFTYQYQADPATAAVDSAVTKGVAKVAAPDPHTVVVTWQKPNPNPYQLFVGVYGHILQKRQFLDYQGARAKDAPGNLKPIGTGPFVVQDFRPGDMVTYAANPLYRDPAKPGFQTVQLKGGGDATSAARAVLQTGDYDYATNLQVEAAVLRSLLDGGKGELAAAVGPLVERVLLNRADPNQVVNGARSEPTTQHPFLSDLRVRQALALATDRQTIAEQLYGAGLTGVATTNLITAPPADNSPNTAKLPIASYDLDQANQLLDQAGWLRGSDGQRAKNGVLMKLVFQTSINSLRQKTQEILKQSWEQLGISVDLKTVDAQVFFSSAAGNPDTAAKFYADAEMFANGSGSPDQTTYLSFWTTGQIAQKSNDWHGNNYERYSNPAYDKLYAQYYLETDPDKRAKMVIQLNDLLVSDVADIPLVARMIVGARSKQLGGVVANPWESDLWNIADWYRIGP
jgi:peptide/nickel transport system substrate-binding protein